MNKLELETKEATYFLEENNTIHFGIDCSCSEYYGYHYKHDKMDKFKLTPTGFIKKPIKKYQHTYYINEALLLEDIKYCLRLNNKPLIIVCNNCNQEYKFTLKSLKDLTTKIRSQTQE